MASKTLRQAPQRTRPAVAANTREFVLKVESQTGHWVTLNDMRQHFERQVSKGL